MSSDVFVIASARDVDTAAALRRAVELAGVGARRVQDAVLGTDVAAELDAASLLASAGLDCPFSVVMPSPRAAFFAAEEILSEEAGIVLAAGVYAEGAGALLLASPEAVGRLNLVPCARLAARSLAGLDAALRLAELTAGDVELTRDGGQPLLVLHEMLEELEGRPARWGAVTSGTLALLVERL